MTHSIEGGFQSSDNFNVGLSKPRAGDDPSMDLENVNAAWTEQFERANAAEVEVERLRDLAAAATRARTRAIHALAGNCDYPESERREMGAWLTEELQR